MDDKARHSEHDLILSIPANIWLFKVNNRNNRQRSEICSKLTIKRHQNFEHISSLFLLFLLLTLNRYMLELGCIPQAITSDQSLNLSLLPVCSRDQNQVISTKTWLTHVVLWSLLVPEHFQQDIQHFAPFHANVPFLYPLKTSENQRFFDVFRGYRNGTLEWTKLG